MPTFRWRLRRSRPGRRIHREAGRRRATRRRDQPRACAHARAADAAARDRGRRRRGSDGSRRARSKFSIWWCRGSPARRSRRSSRSAPHGGKLSRTGHGEDAGRQRRRAGPAGDPPRTHHPVELPPDRCGCTRAHRLDKASDHRDVSIRGEHAVAASERGESRLAAAVKPRPTSRLPPGAPDG